MYSPIHDFPRIGACRLPNHLIRSCQHIGRNREADLLGGLQIDHQLKLHRLLDRKIGGLGTFENLVDEYGGASERIKNVRTIGNEAAGIHKRSVSIHSWKSTLYR